MMNRSRARIAPTDHVLLYGYLRAVENPFNHRALRRSVKEHREANRR